MSDIDTQSPNFEEVTKTIRRQRDKGSRAGNKNFGPKWPLERSSDLSTFWNTKKYLKSVHLKLTTCCSKNYPVVLSFRTHNQNFEYNSKPQSQKIPCESIPQLQNFSSKSISQSQNFQAKNYPKLVHIPVLPHSEVPPPVLVTNVRRNLNVTALWQDLRCCVRADFHSVESSKWTENLLFTWENVAVNLNRAFHVINFLLCKTPSARKILPSGNQR